MSASHSAESGRETLSTDERLLRRRPSIPVEAASSAMTPITFRGPSGTSTRSPAAASMSSGTR